MKFDHTLEADVDYYDDKGIFDARKFAQAAGEVVTKQHQDKAYKQMQVQQSKWEEQRKNKLNTVYIVRTKEVPEINPKQVAIEAVTRKKIDKLQKLVKNSKNIDQQVIKCDKLLNGIPKQFSKPTKIGNQVDKMRLDQQQIHLFHFDQMEKCIN